MIYDTIFVQIAFELGKKVFKIAHLEIMNFIDLQKTRNGREDKGYFYRGFHGEVVNPGDVKVSLADWEPIEKFCHLHKIHTTAVPGQLLGRESSCFSCASCEWGNFVSCRRTNELRPQTHTNGARFFQLLRQSNKDGYTATPVARGWAGAEIEVTRSFGQEQ